MQSSSHSWVRTGLIFVLATVGFALTYTQAPLYFSNQYQYFLHGLAQAGQGLLAEDWLANTADPTPVFSRLVASTVDYLDQRVFYLLYAMLQGVYFLSLWGLFRILTRGQYKVWREVVFLGVIFLLHAAALRVLSIRWFGVDYPWYFQAGLAGQYILGPVFQPSTFGVLLVASVWAYATERRFLASTLVGLAGILHATYLLSAGLLMLGYLLSEWRGGRWREGIFLGGWALFLVSPILIYSYLTFGSTPPTSRAEAQQILVHFRIPHHAIPRLWCDAIAGVQIAWMILGIALIWGSRLFVPLLTLAMGGAILSMVQVGTDSNFLALLFPWRVSAILVPISTAVILTRLLTLTSSGEQVDPRGVGIAWPVAILALVFAASGVIILQQEFGYATAVEEEPLLEYIHNSKQPGNVYLLPVPVPNLEATVKGAKKSDFNPRPPRRSDPRSIAVNLQAFRLDTGAPIYVDFKSIPYEPQDVLEWRRRLAFMEEVYSQLDQQGMGDPLAQALRTEGITHIVVRADLELPVSLLALTYNDGIYRVYRLR